MSNGPEWFAPKRYGYGAGLPITWQGWLLMTVYLAVLVGAVLLWPEKPLLVLFIVLLVSAALVLVAARTTRGGWRWRWGGRD